MKIHWFARRLWPLLMLFLLAGCAEPPAAPMRIGTNVWPGYEPLYLARDREEWSAERFRLVEYPSASEVLRAFRNRSLDAAALTLDEVLQLRQDGLPVKVVLVTDVSHGGDVIMGRPGMSSFTDLRGRRVAVESGALGAYMISRALALNGMALDEVEVVHLPVDAHEAAYGAGEVDALVTFEPVRTRMLARGAVELFSSRQIPGEIVDVLVVHEDFLLLWPERVRELTDGWFRALEMLKGDPLRAGEVIARRLKVSVEEALAGYDGLHLPDRAENRRLLGEAGGLRDGLKRLNRTLAAEGLLYREVSTDGLLSAVAL